MASKQEQRKKKEEKENLVYDLKYKFLLMYNNSTTTSDLRLQLNPASER